MDSPDPAQDPPPGQIGGNGFTFVLLCVGIAMVACCVLIPESDENRALLYQTEKLKGDLDYVQRQVAANKEFVERVGRDPALRERLAQRQLKFVRKGTDVLELQGNNVTEQSPFSIVAVAPPERLAPNKPVGGRLAAMCRNPRSKLYLIGFGLMLMASGLVLGAHQPKS
jgi:hypothetical protein